MFALIFFLWLVSVIRVLCVTNVTKTGVELNILFSMPIFNTDSYSCLLNFSKKH